MLVKPQNEVCGKHDGSLTFLFVSFHQHPDKSDVFVFGSLKFDVLSHMFHVRHHLFPTSVSTELHHMFLFNVTPIFPPQPSKKESISTFFSNFHQISDFFF